jgi:hypothetical protein
MMKDSITGIVMVTGFGNHLVYSEIYSKFIRSRS